MKTKDVNAVNAESDFAKYRRCVRWGMRREFAVETDARDIAFR